MNNLDKRQSCKILKTTKQQVVYYQWSGDLQEEYTDYHMKTKWIDSDELPIIEDCIEEILFVNDQQSKLPFGQYREFVYDIKFEVNGEVLYSICFDDKIQIDLPKGKSFIWEEGMNIRDLIKGYDAMIPRDVTIHYTEGE